MIATRPRPLRAAIGLAWAAFSVCRCKLFGHKFEFLIVPVEIEALEMCDDSNIEVATFLAFALRAARMFELPRPEYRCRRCFERFDLARGVATAAKGGNA